MDGLQEKKLKKNQCIYCDKLLYDISSKYKHMKICAKKPKELLKLIPKTL